MKGIPKKKSVEGLFLDLDGVILKNSVDVYLRYVTDYINEFAPIPLSYVKNYYRTVNSFPLSESLYLVFKSLGITSELNTLFEKILTLRDYKNEKIIIEEGFYSLVDFCSKNNIQYKIFTMASFEKTKLFLADIPNENIYCLDKRSKADLTTYDFIKKDLKINLKNWVLVDDDPLALRTASLCGLKTVFMKNNLFDEAYCNDFKQYFNLIIESLDNIISFVKTIK